MLTFFACSDKIIGWLDCQWQPGSPLWALAGLVGVMVVGVIIAVAVVVHVRRRSSAQQYSYSSTYEQFMLANYVFKCFYRCLPTKAQPLPQR